MKETPGANGCNLLPVFFHSYFVPEPVFFLKSSQELQDLLPSSFSEGPRKYSAPRPEDTFAFRRHTNCAERPEVTVARLSILILIIVLCALGLAFVLRRLLEVYPPCGGQIEADQWVNISYVVIRVVTNGRLRM